MPEDAPGEPRFLTTVLSGTPIADEHRSLEAALRRCPPVLAAFDPASHPAEVIQKARRWWMAMMRTEYESASVFIDMATEARQIAVPLDVQTVLLRMAQDELRHAAICARVIDAMGGEAKIAALPLPRTKPHADCSADESVLRTIIYGCCLGETVNAARLAKRLGEARDPFIREAFRQLLADERLHAQFGFHYLESQRDWLQGRPEVRRSLARYLQYAFAALEQYMGVVPSGARPPTEPERAIGLPDLTDLSATYQETILNACIPGLERFGIEARPAWHARSTAHPPRSPPLAAR